MWFRLDILALGVGYLCWVSLIIQFKGGSGKLGNFWLYGASLINGIEKSKF